MEEREELFFRSLHSVAKEPIVQLLGLEREAELSRFAQMCPIQDVFRFRSRYLGTQIASHVIGTDGTLQTDVLQYLLSVFSSGFFSAGPDREDDALIYAHLRYCLEHTEKAWAWIYKFSFPLCHKGAERIVRETMWPMEGTTSGDALVRRAVFAAWLTMLRQATGSCFATAPATLIQKNYTRFFQDLYELLTTGQLQRVVQGKEYAVPMCVFSGSHDLDKAIPLFDALCFSPGLILALEEAECLPKGANMRQNAERLRVMLQQVRFGQTLHSIVKEITLYASSLTEQEIADEEYAQRVHVGIMAAKEGAVFYQKPTPKALKVAEWKKRFHKATTALRCFTDCPLLQSWEYTIASFCDLKTDFSKWNLSIGLGMQLEEKEGIGEFLYRKIDDKLQEGNREVLFWQQEYEKSANAVRAIEAMLRNAHESQLFALRGEMTRAAHEAQSALDKRDDCYKKTEALSQFFTFCIRLCDEKFPEYFQEVFDPSVAEIQGDLLVEDSPAGFRLLYKHGRRDASLWTLIYDQDAYVNALRSFFAAIEGEMVSVSDIDRNFVSDLTTQLIQFIQSDAFLQAAHQRAQKARRKTPWAYVSGGTMQGLVQAYFNRAKPLTEAAVLLRSVQDLLRIVAGLKAEKPLLIHSPTHAFVIRPDVMPNQMAERGEENRKSAGKGKCTEEMQEWIFHTFSEKIAEQEKALFLHVIRQKPWSDTLTGVREAMLDAAHSVRSTPYVALLIDAHLYDCSFVLTQKSVEDTMMEVLCSLSLAAPEQIRNVLSELFFPPFIGIRGFHQLAKEILLRALQTPLPKQDWDALIASAMRRFGCGQKYLLLFADTNWSGWFFGFVAHPFTGKQELWRLNRLGTIGYPMRDWDKWFSADNTLPWVLLTHPEEY